MPSRRHFLRLPLAAAPLILPAHLLRGETAPSNKIHLGFIGVGNHGLNYNLRSFLQRPEARAVAVCDVFKSRQLKAKQAVDEHYGDTACRTYGDFRELLAQPDIDAVVISTPDHWHTPISLLATQAGKDVFCEKPTLTIAEGRELVDTIKQHDRIFQVGLEDRSEIYYHRIAELVRNGAIGELQRILVRLPAGSDYPKEAPAPVPDDLDWNMWLGPAPFHDYSPTRTEPMPWRNIRDYSGGLLADWGAHLIDTAQVANFAELSSPVEVEGTGTVPPDSLTTMPVDYHLHYRYANGVTMEVESGAISLRFEGTDGWVGNEGWRGPVQASSDEILRATFPKESNELWALPPSEHRNFLDCIKSRQPTTYPAEHGHRLSSVMHIGNIAIGLGRKLHWDPDAEQFKDDPQADALRSRAPRDWTT